MTLNEWAAEKKKAIFENLKSGHAPTEGEYDAAVLREALVKGPPQMGATKYEPDAANMEFIFPDVASSATVLTVRVQSPERIVYLPVPDWVIEDIWQGAVSGSYHFESRARELVRELESELSSDNNVQWFAPQPAKRRE